MAYRKIQPILREALRGCFDGMTVRELVEQTGIEDRQVRRVLHNMETVYIDRWKPGGYQTRTQAIYCIVEIPENCPRPSKG
jgi:hypothetical protein